MSQEKNQQILTFIDFVDYFKPKYVLMENVTGMLMNSNVFDVPQFIISKFKDIGYDIRISVFNAIHFGIPQSRLFFLGQKTNTTQHNSSLVQFPIPTHAGKVHSSIPNIFKNVLFSYPKRIQSGSMPPVNLRDYICDLKPLEESMNLSRRRRTTTTTPLDTSQNNTTQVCSLSSYPRDAMTVYQKIARRGCNTLTNMEYREYNHSFLTTSVIRCLPRRSGATIEDLEFVELRKSISKKKKSKKSFKRLEWSKPSACIVTNMDVNHFEFIHPTENRILTIRECARIQGFPDTFVFVDDRAPLCRSQKLKEKYTQIGNAVPVVFGFKFGIEIRKAFMKSIQESSATSQNQISIITTQLQRIFKETRNTLNNQTTLSGINMVTQWTEQDFKISDEFREGVTLEFRKAEKEFHVSDEFVSHYNDDIEQTIESETHEEEESSINDDMTLSDNSSEASPLM
nr:unnamed protein product [Naegleria fowleri]